MQYDAITIDTNIFRHNGWHLEGGMLGQLSGRPAAQFETRVIAERDIATPVGSVFMVRFVSHHWGPTYKAISFSRRRISPGSRLPPPHTHFRNSPGTVL